MCSFFYAFFLHNWNDLLTYLRRKYILKNLSRVELIAHKARSLYNVGWNSRLIFWNEMVVKDVKKNDMKGGGWGWTEKEKKLFVIVTKFIHFPPAFTNRFQSLYTQWWWGMDIDIHLKQRRLWFIIC